MIDPSRREAGPSPCQLDEIAARCDRFKAAWKADTPVRIEDELTGVPDALRSALFSRLLSLEIELRKKRGDRPTPPDYQARFPNLAAEIAAAFVDHAPQPAAIAPADGNQTVARDLLFGLLAFQNGFIDRDVLLGAFNFWTADKSQPLGELLRSRGALDHARYELMTALVNEHLKLHGGIPEASLAALSSIDAIRADLEQIADPVVLSTLTVIGANQSPTNPTAAALPSSSARQSGERFRILRFHRQGGLGQIHVAHDEELGRDVALKEILPNKAHIAQLRSRFVLEAQINGGLEHPGIVPIYSLGTYSDGKPYYAMRFVQGDSLNEAIDEFHRAHPRPDPSTVEFRKLLARFIDVCETIAYAHSKGVLHRDLKPQNIMLGRYGEALIIDWGLAKATGKRIVVDADSPEATLTPASGDSHHPTIGAIGSPPYMSPEQARGETDYLGAATDVYGLGATLYHLLTGRPPVRSEPGESVESILEKVSRGAVAPPRSLNPSVPSALEAVCLQALALRPEDRFPSAMALAEDVEHWLADEPVSARPDPPLARAARWGRKHRTVMALWLVALMGVGLLGTTAGLVAINRERTRAITAENQARLNLMRAEKEEQRAKRSEADTLAVHYFFRDKVLAAGRPKGQDGGLGPGVTLRAAIDAAESSIEVGFGARPAVEAATRDALGVSYLSLREPVHAIRHLERARAILAEVMGPNETATLANAHNLAIAYLQAKRVDAAIVLFEDVSRRRESKFGKDHADTLASRTFLGDAYREKGEIDRAITIQVENLKRMQGAVLRSSHGIFNLRTDLTVESPGAPLPAAAREAKDLMTLSVFLGSPPALVIETVNNLAAALLETPASGLAVELLEDALKLSQRSLAPDDSVSISTLIILGSARRADGQVDIAAELYEEALKRTKAKWGVDHPDTLARMTTLAETYRDSGRADEAVKLMEQVVTKQASILGAAHRDTLQSMSDLGGAYLEANRWAAAEATLRESLSQRQKRDPDDWWRFHNLSQLGAALAGQSKFAEAETLLLEGYNGLTLHKSRIPAPKRKLLTRAGERLISLYDAWGKKVKADEWKTKLGLSDLPADVFARP